VPLWKLVPLSDCFREEGISEISLQVSVSVWYVAPSKFVVRNRGE